MTNPWRLTSQDLMPARAPGGAVGGYEIYPHHDLGPGLIEVGFEALASRLVGHNAVVIDGFIGVSWEDLRSRLTEAFHAIGIRTSWLDVSTAHLPVNAIDDLVRPFLGGDDPLFGTAFTGALADFFDSTQLTNFTVDLSADITVLYGCGAALAGWDATLVYVDLPKNEIQFRARAGQVRNLGASEAANHREAYKRCYFVDWPALAVHKAALLPQLDLIVDGQRRDDPTVMSGDDLRSGLSRLGKTVFRARPWFEPGPWGGQWIKEHMPQLPRDVPNYAWSFELISPENGLVFGSDGFLLEVSFDFLMFQSAEQVLGESAARFGSEFPIRFDFLDTFDGGNLSLQVHPSPDYIRDHFGERFTQDETYYILDCDPGAEVYLGFQENVDPAEFRAALEQSSLDGVVVDVPRFVQLLPAARHDLFLIPHGTIHCSGVGNLVLEISATPYIFTFKLYDWLRLDLEGKPRHLNIDRGFENLDFDRQGARVTSEFVSIQTEVDRGPGWRVVHVPTHRDHFYDVHRIEFEGAVTRITGNSVQVMSLVEGGSVVVESGGVTQRFAYAETFIVPAAAKKFTLRSDDGPVKVISAFVKEGRGPR